MLEAINLKVFLPAKNFSESRGFYRELGFTENWSNDDLAEFQLGQNKFLLQDFYEQKLAENLMMQLVVRDLDAWCRAIQDRKLVEAYSEVKIRAPEIQPWGQRVMYLWDPSGILWHFAEESK